jgi:hypothetical protein
MMNRAVKVLRLVALSLACTSVSTTAVFAKSPEEDGFVLHEWGTFTTVSGSDGELLPGLQREEEALPAFVFAHEGMENKTGMQSKGWTRPLHNVLVKMETPVIYFYSEHGFRAHVEVGFRGGSISQWYPQRSDGEVPPSHTVGGEAYQGGGIDFATPYQGHITWDVDVLSRENSLDALAFKGGETLNWVYPRQTDSNILRNKQGEHEKYLFYRGVGNFPLPVRFRMPTDDRLEIENHSHRSVPALFVFDHDKSGMVRFQRVDTPGGDAVHTVDLATIDADGDWRRAVYEDIVAALVSGGLYRREADAMVQTWWESYFEEPGLRVFWIVPTAETERALPLQVEPAPREKVRVLVGRSEVLRPSFEERLVRDFSTKETRKSWSWDRYFLAYKARVEALGGQVQ